MDSGSERASGYLAYHGCSPTPWLAEAEATDASTVDVVGASMLCLSEQEWLRGEVRAVRAVMDAEQEHGDGLQSAFESELPESKSKIHSRGDGSISRKLICICL